MKQGIFKIYHKDKKIKINYFCNFISKNEISIDREKYLNICRENCDYYGKNYSCPPYAPRFSKYLQQYNNLFVVMFRIRLNQIDLNGDYEKLKLCNRLIREEIEKLMWNLEKLTKSKFLSSGPCKLCSKCLVEINKPCKYQQKMRYSLEALGVECKDLSQRLFNEKMEWHQNGVLPKKTSVISAIPLNKVNQNDFEKRVDTLINVIDK